MQGVFFSLKLLNCIITRIVPADALLHNNCNVALERKREAFFGGGGRSLGRASQAATIYCLSYREFSRTCCYQPCVSRQCKARGPRQPESHSCRLSLCWIDAWGSPKSVERNMQNKIKHMLHTCTSLFCLCVMFLFCTLLKKYCVCAASKPISS